MDMSKEGIKNVEIEKILRYFCIGVIDYIVINLAFPITDTSFYLFDNLGKIFPGNLIYILIPVLGMTHYTFHRVIIHLVESLLGLAHHSHRSRRYFDDKSESLIKRYDEKYFSNSLSGYMHLRWAMVHYWGMIAESFVLLLFHRPYNLLRIIIILSIIIVLLTIYVISYYMLYQLEKSIYKKN